MKSLRDVYNTVEMECKKLSSMHSSLGFKSFFGFLKRTPMSLELDVYSHKFRVVYEMCFFVKLSIKIILTD